MKFNIFVMVDIIECSGKSTMLLDMVGNDDKADGDPLVEVDGIEEPPNTDNDEEFHSMNGEC